MNDTTLVLADGTCFTGRGFGLKAPHPTDLHGLPLSAVPLGEVVFNTTMGAYHEIVTDPSYAGQTIVMTSAHVGNYGCDDSWNEMLGTNPFCKALVLRDLYEGPLPTGRYALADACGRWRICGMTDVDTRALTLHVRNRGAQYGVVVSGGQLDDREVALAVDWMVRCPSMAKRDFIEECSVSVPSVVEPLQKQRAHFALWDFGTKRSIIEQLSQRGIRVTVFPSSTPLSDIFAVGHPYDALFLSNGPGDPAVLDGHVAQIASMLGRVPIVGICLGHQIAARALGAKTLKMLFGHHGPNHPVRDLLTQNVYVTAQNHGYCVDPSSFPDTTRLWLVNDNDRTVEGYYDNRHRVMTVQFHPEAGPGPWEARVLFDRFISFVEGESFTETVEEATHAS